MTTFLTRNPATGKLEEILALSNSDAVGRQRVSNPETLLDLNHIYDKQPLYVEELTASGGAGTHLPNEAAVRMSVTTTVGSRVVRQTRRYLNYQAGKSLLVMLTGVLVNASNTGIRSRIGFFDDDNDKIADSGGNGVFFQYSGGVVSIVKRSFITGTQVDTVVNQAFWSENSTYSIDPTKAQIFWFDMEWLGVGTIRCGVVHEGQYICLHKFHHDNLINTVYMTRASLPVRYEIEQITGASAANMKQICATVISEGGHPKTGRICSRPRTTAVNINTTLLPIISIRLRAGYERGVLQVLSSDILTTANQQLIYQVLYGASVTGGTWVSHDTTNSGVEYNISATAVTGGRIVDSGYVGSVNRQSVFDTNTFDSAGVSIAGTPEIITLAALATGAATTYGSITWQETY